MTVTRHDQKPVAGFPFAPSAEGQGLAPMKIRFSWIGLVVAAVLLWAVIIGLAKRFF